MPSFAKLNRVVLCLVRRTAYVSEQLRYAALDAEVLLTLHHRFIALQILLAPKPAAPAGRPGGDPNSVSSTGLAFLSSQLFTYFVEVFVLERVWLLA